MLTKKSLIGRLRTIRSDVGWATRPAAILNIDAFIDEIEREGVEAIPPARRDDDRRWHEHEDRR